MKSIILLLSILLLFTSSLVAESEAKEIKVFNFDAVSDFYDARDYEVRMAIKNLKKLPQKREDNFRTIKGNNFWADYFIRDDAKILISQMHFDANAMHPEDRDKEKLLKRFGIDSNEPADKLMFGDGTMMLYLEFNSKTLKSVDIDIQF